MNASVIQAIAACRFSPIGALSNLAFYCAKNLTPDDAATVFDEWIAVRRDGDGFEPETRERAVSDIRHAIAEGKL
jgi:hypothetical protein